MKEEISHEMDVHMTVARRDEVMQNRRHRLCLLYSEGNTARELQNYILFGWVPGRKQLPGPNPERHLSVKPR